MNHHKAGESHNGSFWDFLSGYFIQSDHGAKEATPLPEPAAIEAASVDIAFFEERLDVERVLFQQTTVLRAISSAALEQSYSHQKLLEILDREIENFKH